MAYQTAVGWSLVSSGIVTLLLGFLRSLNLTGAPIHGLIDCIAVNVLR